MERGGGRVMKVICVQEIMLPFHSHLYSTLPHNLYRNPFTLLLHYRLAWRTHLSQQVPL